MSVNPMELAARSVVVFFLEMIILTYVWGMKNVILQSVKLISIE